MKHVPDEKVLERLGGVQFDAFVLLWHDRRSGRVHVTSSGELPSEVRSRNEKG